MSSIRAEKLTISYDEKLIVDSLAMNIPKGKITTIIGANGCGKSTILKALGRIIKQKSGVVYLNGKDIRELSTKEVAKKMAILPQSPQAPDGLTVSDLVAYGRFPYQKGMGNLKEEDKKIIEWAIEVTKLEEYANTAIDNLSGGQRQRAWIAMALAQKTDLILLDEPTTYLDMAYQLEVLELLEHLNKTQKCTIVMVLHDLNLAARFADYMIAIKGGKVVSHGEPDKVMTDSVLKETFNIKAEIIKDSISKKPLCLTYNLCK